jgi:hypothetical protein
VSLPQGTVAFLFTDIEGSTRLLQKLGDQYANVLAAAAAREGLHTHRTLWMMQTEAKEEARFAGLLQSPLTDSYHGGFDCGYWMPE